MTYKCKACHDTGSISKDIAGQWDCTSCETPTERVGLEMWLQQFMPVDGNVAWAIYQRALAMAPKQEARKPTDISKRLREYAGNSGYSHNDYADTMRAAADEIERYYGGMVAWKNTAEKKDSDWNAERMARVDDRIAGRQEGPFELDYRMPPKDVGVLVYWPCTDGTYEVRMDEWSDLYEDPIGMGGPTICVGEGWVSYGDENITHWAPIATPLKQAAAAPASANGALTDEQIDAIGERMIKVVAGERISYGQAREFARAILAAAGPDAALIDAKHLVDITTAIMSQHGLIDHLSSGATQAFCDDLRAALSGVKGN